MLGERIRKLRDERGLSQKQLADRLGVKKQTVSNWENGNAMPSMDMFVRVVELLHTTPNYLLGYEAKVGLDVTGLFEHEIDHIRMHIDDLKAHHRDDE